MGMFFAGVLIFLLISFFIKRTEINSYRKKDFNWYKISHPEAFKGNRITCYGCGNGRIHTRPLKKRRYTKIHFCTQCGKNLYYSPE